MPLRKGPLLPHLFIRVDKAGGVWVDENGYVVLSAAAEAGAISQVSTWRKIGYGTYNWRARIVNPGGYKAFFVGFGEEGPAYGDIGIFLKHDGANQVFETRKGGSVTATNINTPAWTTERLFTVEWTPTSVKVYVDGALVATHTTNIPNVKLVRFTEIWHDPVMTPTTRSFIYARDFGEND